MSATEKCTEFAFDPDLWEDAIFAERFLYPLLNPEEAATFRAMGRLLFYRFLEYQEQNGRQESTITADLRGAVRDLHLVARFVEAIGQSFDAEDLRLEDVSLVPLAAKFSPQIADLARHLEAKLPNEGRR